MRVVRYLWALVLAMGVVLVFSAACSFIAVTTDAFACMKLPSWAKPRFIQVGWAAVYALTVITCTRVAAGMKPAAFAACTAVLALYVLWCVVFAVFSLYAVSFAVNVVICIASGAVCVYLTLRDGMSGVIYSPVVLWHAYLCAAAYAVFIHVV